MGFIFNNITQLADHLINESNSKAKTKNVGQESGENAPDFATFLGSAKCNRKSNPLLDGLSQLNREIEVKEKAEIPISIVKAAISNNKDKLTILISAEQLKGLLAKFNLSLFPQPPSSSDGQINSGNAILSALPDNTPLKLSFNPSDLFDAAGKIKAGDIPAAMVGASSTNEAKIDIQALIKLIGEYPDPIDLELSDSFTADELPPAFSGFENKGKGFPESMQDPIVKSSFIFDLREIVNKLDDKVQANIKGILTQSQTPVSIDDFTALSNISSKGESFFLLPINADKSRVITEKTANNMSSDISKLSSNVSLSGSEIINDSDISLLKNSRQLEQFVNRVNSIFKESLSLESKNPIKDQILQNLSKDFHQNSNLQTQDGSKAGSLSGLESKIPASLFGNSKAANPVDTKSDSIQGSNKGQLPEDIKGVANNVSLKPEFVFAKNESGKILSSPKIINVEFIKSAIFHAVGNNLTSLKLRLHPENLGNIDIRMIWKNDAVSITLKADTSEAARLMTSNLADLKSGLENANFKINEISVVLDNSRNSNDYNPQNRDFTNSTANGGGHQRRSDSELSNQISKKHESEFLSDSHEEYSASVIRGRIDLKA